MNIQYKISAILFDLDGTLTSDSRTIHYEALNVALAKIDLKYVISEQDHLTRFDGRTTTNKLNMLSDERGLPKEFHNQIWKDKQAATLALINVHVSKNQRICDLFEILKSKNYKIAVCSNAIRDIVLVLLKKLDLLGSCDYIYSNEDCPIPKPSSSIYLRAMLDMKVDPVETLILEDSPIGRTAARNSGAHLLEIRNPDDVTLENIMNKIDEIEHNKKMSKLKWKGGNLNVLIPMAGLGSRFTAAGYEFIKPLIEVVPGKTMIQVVVENLNMDARHIFIVQKEHNKKYNLRSFLKLLVPNSEIVEVDGLTDGAARTVLAAKNLIDSDSPLLIANSDQYIEWDSNAFMYSMMNDEIAGGIATFTSTHPKWSYAKLGEDGFVCEVAEKNPISNIATCGVYYYKSGKEFVAHTEQMIQQDIRTNGEFYVCPIFNEYVKANKHIKVFPVTEMFSMGVPTDLQYFQKQIENGNVIL